MTTYETDFYTWAMEQAAAIRAGHYSQLDIENIAEELESMGRSEKRALNSRLSVLLAHLLKWQYQPARRGNSWQLTIEGQRNHVIDLLDDNPGLKNQLDAILAHAYKQARIQASQETGIDKQHFPTLCPWEFSQIMNEDFYPQA